MPKIALKSILGVAAILVQPDISPGETEGVNVDAVYSADILRAVSGGISTGNAYLDNLDLTVELDADTLWGVSGAEFFLYGLYNNGARFSERYVGDAQVASNIETGEKALRLYEAWVQFDLGETMDVRFGLYDLNSEFDALESSALYLGSAHGIGTDIGQSGKNGPSIFPNTSLALRVATQLNADWRLQFAALDGVPGDPDRTDRTAIKLRGEDGALLIGELQRIRPTSRLLIGAWAYTKRTDEQSPQGAANERRRNSGVYLRGEALVSDARGELMAFGRVGIAADEINLFSHFISGGLTWRAFSQARSDDEMGIAFAWAETSDEATATAEDREIAFELTYRLQLAERLAVQPSIQYIVNPGPDAALDDAWIAGARFVFQIF